MKRETINNRKLRIMEQVKTKVWRVVIKIPTEEMKADQKEDAKTIDWSFTLMLN